MEGIGGTAGAGEPERFARLLRGLKERSGLSYGVLARTLHTSTSTLHRYCKGEALPAEFAVVDRFARACGATQSEALELHRAWLLADARRRATPRGGEREGLAVGGSGPAAEADAHAHADVVPGPDSADRPVPADASGPASGPPPGPQPGEAAEPAVALAAGPEAADGAEGREARWYRGRRAVAGAVVGVAAVVLAATGLAMAGPPGRDGADRAAGGRTATSSARAGTGGGAGGARTGVPTPGPSPSGSGEPSPATGSGPDSGPSASASGGPVPGPTSGTSTAPAKGREPSSPAAGGEARLRTAVRSHVWANGCDHAYLIDRNPGSVPPPPVEADAPSWAKSQGAVHAGRQIVEATLHGTGSGAIVVQGIDVRVTARRAPLPWNVHLMSPGCGGALTPAAFTVNLDAPRPVARPAAGHDGENAIPAPAFPLRVSAGDPVVLRIEAAASGCDCEWYAEVRWTGPAGAGLTRIDDDGRPLRTSASGGRPQYGYAAELGRWSRG
ncbi:helix-turn-helix transcriptional regulator [Streptomyces sp. NPDC089799]|uniref:helix-turn-helix domain-containing protein n=1 Tax=Streptomyces sp. NPDC089799 TaxID=3155066 RepID=UPI00342DBA16